MVEIIPIRGETNIRDFVQHYLDLNGFPNPNLDEPGAFIGRVFNAEQIHTLLETGTDRNEHSTICTPQEKRALEEEQLGTANIIYGGRLGIVIAYTLPDLRKHSKKPKALSVYDSQKLEHAIPAEKLQAGIDDMYKVKAPHTFKEGLIAVFSLEN